MERLLDPAELLWYKKNPRHSTLQSLISLFLKSLTSHSLFATMVFSTIISVLAVAGSLQLVDGQSRICHAAGCKDCPVSTTDSGIGFPDCTVYDSEDVFSGLFEKSEETG